MRNKKAQITGIGIGIMIALFIFLVGIINVNFIKDEVTTARDSSNLNCAAPSSDGTKLTCLVVDWVVPYFIIIILASSGGAITARLLL